MTFTQKCLTISFLLISFQVHSVEPPRSEVETINAVIKEFQDSILQKDKKRFLALFQSETTPFIGINSDADVELSKRSGKTGLDKVFRWDHAGFMDWIVTSEKKIEEKISDIDIKTDGDIASVFFTYRLMENGRENNSGVEAWQLIKTADGWKINSVIWSMHRTPDSKD